VALVIVDLGEPDDPREVIAAPIAAAVAGRSVTVLDRPSRAPKDERCNLSTDSDADGVGA
jgi:hypothetical protein